MTATNADSWQTRRTRFLDGLQAKLSAFSRQATGFVSQPEPRTIGSYARGKQVISGNFVLAGYLVEAPDTLLWDLPMPSSEFREELHGFTWLDDVAAVGDAQARARAQEWVLDWIARYGSGGMPGWSADLTGRRLIRLINHALFLLQGQDRVFSDAYFRTLARQTHFLSRRWKGAAPGVPRFEALTGLIYAGLSLEGVERHVAPAVKALRRECREQIDAQGGIPTRNPEELLEVFTLLTWTAAALNDRDHNVPADLLAAVERIAPSLRSLRHSDGGLARFHGGGRGAEGRLDQALASSGVRASANYGLSMGFVRLSAGRSSVITDAAVPPVARASVNGHASTLAFELSSGRRPLIVNCGSGRSFGSEWRRAGRATQSHSTLAIEGYSSSRLGARTLVRGRQQELLIDSPGEVGVQQTRSEDGFSLTCWHDGYVATHGLTHARRLDLSTDGRILSGEDTLGAFSGPDRTAFDKAMDRTRLQGVAFALHFHLHPDVDAEIDMGGGAVSLVLRSGEIWVFRHFSGAHLDLAPSVYLERGRLKPRASKQIVLSARALEYASQINWTLAKAQDTPQAVRDLEMDALPFSD